MNTDSLKYIRYTFIDAGFRGPFESRYDTEWTLFPDGMITVRTFEKRPGIDREIGRTKRVLSEKETISIEPSEVQRLMDSLQSGFGEFNRMMDAMDKAKIVYSYGQTIEFNPAPRCLHEFFFSLNHNN